MVIPYFAIIKDGIPDFRVVDEVKRHAAVYDRLCWICGNPMPQGLIAFIGGERSVQNRSFIDPASHVECAMYAAKVCPYLNGERRQYAKTPSRVEKDPAFEHMKVEQHVPRRLAIYLTARYWIKPYQGSFLIEADKARQIIWDAMPETK